MTVSMPAKQRVEPLVDLHGRSAWSVLPPLLLGFFMIMVDTTIVNIAVPTLKTTFDASYIAVGWVSSAYLLSFAVLLLLAGRLGDRYGPKPLFAWGLVVFTAASAWCGFSGTIGWLIAARAVQGVGAALMTPQTMAMITRVFPTKGRGAAMGLWGATAGVATIAGPLLGGVLIETLGWEWIFFINVPVGAVALYYTATRLPRLQTNKRYFDLVGVALSVVGLTLFVFGLQEGETYAWGTIAGPLTVWSIIAAGVVVLTGFVLWQHRLGERALLPLRLFRSRNFTLANACGIAVMFAMVGVFFPLTIYVQSIMGLSPLRAALLTLPSSVVSGVIAPVAGRLVDRMPAKWIIAVGFGALAGAVFWLSVIVTPGVQEWEFIGPMAVFGLGTACVFSPTATLASSSLDQRTAGAGAGAYNTLRQTGGVLGSAAIVAALTMRLAREIPAAAQQTAASLPEQLRAPFIQGMDRAAAAGVKGGGMAPPVPAGTPADVTEQLGAAARQAVDQGFAHAVGQTLLLVVTVLVVGLIAALALRVSHDHTRQGDGEAGAAGGGETPAGAGGETPAGGTGPAGAAAAGGVRAD